MPLPPITDFACVEAVEGDAKTYRFAGDWAYGAEHMATWFYQKAVLSRSPSEHADHAVMIIHRDMDWVSFVRPGGSNCQVASTLDVNGKDRYADCVYHNGAFYILTVLGIVEKWDLEGPNGPTKEVIVSKMQYLPGLLTRYLVSTLWGDLLQVRAISRGQVKNGMRLQVREGGGRTYDMKERTRDGNGSDRTRVEQNHARPHARRRPPKPYPLGLAGKTLCPYPCPTGTGMPGGYPMDLT
uniref:KIB1-4 beta-propeller domain-containing protein n=1 Tax=Oryza meridionalis TaxID=40149 RepID=A0A0E0DH71_9ORYZ